MNEQEFTTVHSVGGLLPPDLLHRIAIGDDELGGLHSEYYGIASSVHLREAAARAWNRTKAYWAAFRAAREGLLSGDTGIAPTRQQWLLPLLRELGYGDPEYRASAEEISGRPYVINYRSGSVPLHLISYLQDLDKSVSSSSDSVHEPYALLQEYLTRVIPPMDIQTALFCDYYVQCLLTRMAYLEFDLEGMFDGGVYADFILLFLVLHRTRLPMQSREPNTCWLERWREQAENQGTRALGELRNGVAEAIIAIGNGFLAHPANHTLRRRLLSEELSVHDYYQQLLRIVYRLIFLFVAEERGLIFTETADPNDKAQYYRNYSASRLRDLPAFFTDVLTTIYGFLFMLL
jgi:hypothetical protein